VLYVSGEESGGQLKLRAKRLGVVGNNLYILTETNLERILSQTDKVKPDVIIVDSIQTIYSETASSTQGSVTQVKECTLSLISKAKSEGISVILVGHVNKEGGIAGPKVLEHMVDAVLYFEGERQQSYRIIRAMKNRYGSTNEIGVFEMTDTGLCEVANPSEILLSHYDEPLAGSAVGAAVDGLRPYLIEVQALVSGAAYGTPQRSTTGFDQRRLNMLLAVLEKRVGMKMFQKDVFLNFAGGFKIADTGMDLAVIAAIISSYYDRPLAEGVCCAGEIGLSGEVRPAPRTDQRISEAARLGFKRIVVSSFAEKSVKRHKDIEVVFISSIEQLPKALF
jgi:DNA repair protein RadA/Sms